MNSSQSASNTSKISQNFQVTQQQETPKTSLNPSSSPSTNRLGITPSPNPTIDQTMSKTAKSIILNTKSVETPNTQAKQEIKATKQTPNPSLKDRILNLFKRETELPDWNGAELHHTVDEPKTLGTFDMNWDNWEGSETKNQSTAETPSRPPTPSASKTPSPPTTPRASPTPSKEFVSVKSTSDDLATKSPKERIEILKKLCQDNPAKAAAEMLKLKPDLLSPQDHAEIAASLKKQPDKAITLFENLLKNEILIEKKEDLFRGVSHSMRFMSAFQDVMIPSSVLETLKKSLQANLPDKALNLKDDKSHQTEFINSFDKLMGTFVDISKSLPKEIKQMNNIFKNVLIERGFEGTKFTPQPFLLRYLNPKLAMMTDISPIQKKNAMQVAKTLQAIIALATTDTSETIVKHSDSPHLANDAFKQGSKIMQDYNQIASELTKI